MLQHQLITIDKHHYNQQHIIHSEGIESIGSIRSLIYARFFIYMDVHIQIQL